MSNQANDELYDRALEDVQEWIEYTAVLKYDGQVIGKVSASSADALAAELYKLEQAEVAYTHELADERIESDYYSEG